MKNLRRKGGLWLSRLRERRGLSQSQLAARVGCGHYILISQIENGRAGISPDSYVTWADALEVPRGEFMRQFLSYYDPKIYELLFEDEPSKSSVS